MKQYALLSVLIVLLMSMLPFVALADIIDEPFHSITGGGMSSLLPIIILVAALALITVLIIRRLKKPSVSIESSRSADE